MFFLFPCFLFFLGGGGARRNRFICASEELEEYQAHSHGSMPPKEGIDETLG